MNPFVLSGLAAVALLAACSSGDARRGAVTTTFASKVDHPFFPLSPGSILVYEGDEDGVPLREEVFTLEHELAIDGVDCAGIVQEIYVDGELVEVTTEWYAQDAIGNVWKFGEESLERSGAVLVDSASSWLAGERGAMPWIQFPARLAEGERHRAPVSAGADEFEVVSLSAVAVVPAGVFHGCLQIVENPDHPDDPDIILYAPGVGRVAEKSTTGQVELVGTLRR